jgi:hypothetical protein
MTPYSNVFKRFERQITDFDLDGLILANKQEIEIELLNNACAQYTNTINDLTRNDTTMEFTYTLSEHSELVLANYMVQGWCKPYVNSQELFETHFSTSEYKEFSPSAKMAQIRELMDYAEREAGRLSTKISIKNVMGRLN